MKATARFRRALQVGIGTILVSGLVIVHAHNQALANTPRNIDFHPVVTYDSPSRPCELGRGDFNGDGYADVVVANANSNSVSVLLNNGNGSFSPLAPTISLLGPGDIEISDLDGDGWLDILATNTLNDIDPGTVSIYFGLGNAAFTSPQVITSGVHPTSLMYADLNNDNLVDIATSNFYGNSISVLLRESQLFSTFLPLVTDNRPLFLIAINPVAQPLSPISQQGQIYYTTTLTINSPLPTTGRFYLSALSNAVAEVRVDDQLRVWADDQVLYEKTLTTPQVVEISRSELESWRNQELTITFRDVAGSVYGNSPVWLIWVP